MTHRHNSCSFPHRWVGVHERNYASDEVFKYASSHVIYARALYLPDLPKGDLADLTVCAGPRSKPSRQRIHPHVPEPGPRQTAVGG